MVRLMRVGDAGSEVPVAEVALESSVAWVDISGFAGDITSSTVGRYASDEFESYVREKAESLPRVE